MASSTSPSEAQREKIVQMITDSWITHPKQDRIMVGGETRRIARTVFGPSYTDSHVGTVRAIRANYTMGRYGAPATLRRNRKRQLASS